MTTGTLFVSFWSLCLENLPEGGFTRRRLTPDEATLAVGQAREGKTLLCLTDTDLLAPYHERERGNHEALRRVLKEHFGIVLAFRDFCGKAGGDDEGLYPSELRAGSRPRPADDCHLRICLRSTKP
jgi:hypothetical protein